ncbi:MAG: aromatic-ring hydroxylase C-terminal domain-containing protein, partial [Phenylobacterium sp.]
MAFKRRNASGPRPAHYEDDTEAGRAARAAEGERILATHAPQYATKGLNYAFFYESSPIIAHDGEEAPAYDMGSYAPSTVPGCRAPHFFTRDGTSLYDLIGDGYALLRFDPSVDAAPLAAAAAQRGVPFKILDLDHPGEPAYRHALVLVRSDDQVAWRGDSLPKDPLQLIDLVRGALIDTAREVHRPVADAPC